RGDRKAADRKRQNCFTRRKLHGRPYRGAPDRYPGLVQLLYGKRRNVFERCKGKTIGGKSGNVGEVRSGECGNRRGNGRGNSGTSQNRLCRFSDWYRRAGRRFGRETCGYCVYRAGRRGRCKIDEIYISWRPLPDPLAVKPGGTRLLTKEDIKGKCQL